MLPVQNHPATTTRQEPTPVPRPVIHTVLGPIPSAELGRALVHEHLLVDFAGASRVSRSRYDPDEAFRVLLPYLKEVRESGFDSFFECTPMYLGRDPGLWRRLSEASEVHIVSNTGMYAAGSREGEPELAGGWLKEWYEGIEGTGIRPGFIKIGVTPGGMLRPVAERIVRAAAITSRRTGLAIACHTVEGVSARRILDLLEEEKVAAHRYIYVHAQGEADRSHHHAVARRGGWISVDGVSAGSLERDLDLVMDLLEQGFEQQILISQDAGWFRPGEPGGGRIRGFTDLPRLFLPALRARGVPEATVDHLLVHNPRRAFEVLG
jgi:phosphotriesterase-related protein